MVITGWSTLFLYTLMGSYDKNIDLLAIKMISIHSRDVDIYDSLAKILNENTQRPLGP